MFHSTDNWPGRHLHPILLHITWELCLCLLFVCLYVPCGSSGLGQVVGISQSWANCMQSVLRTDKNFRRCQNFTLIVFDWKWFWPAPWPWPGAPWRGWGWCRGSAWGRSCRTGRWSCSAEHWPSATYKIQLYYVLSIPKEKVIIAAFSDLCYSLVC